MSNSTARAIPENHPAPAFSLAPRNFEEAMKFADLMAKSDLVPKDFKDKPGNILVAIQKGYEVGLSPMAALETIAVINGRASLWGDGMLGIVQGSTVYEWIDESQSSDTSGVCTVKRKGEPPYTATFSLEDAKRAGLLGKAGPWTSYTKRMLHMRARGFALRDKFADVLKGMIAAEEAMDMQADVVRTEAPPPTPSLKERLKEQLAGPATPEPPDRSVDAGIMKQEFDDRLKAAENVKAASTVMNDVLDSDLPTDWKQGFNLRFKERMADRQPAKAKKEGGAHG